MPAEANKALIRRLFVEGFNYASMDFITGATAACEEQHYSPKRKRSIKRLVINEIKAAEILGPLYQNPTQKT